MAGTEKSMASISTDRFNDNRMAYFRLLLPSYKLVFLYGPVNGCMLLQS